jgi:chromosome segregation ATPase
MPVVAVSQIERALNNKDGTEFSQVYSRYVYEGNVFGTCVDDIYDYLEQWINPVVNEYNEKFTNFETQEELDEYLKEEYGTIFFLDNDSTDIQKYGAFDELYTLRDSKISCSELKSQMDDCESKIEEIKQKVSSLYKFNDELSGGLISEQQYECNTLSLELTKISISLDYIKNDIDINGVNYDTTLQNLKKYEYKIDELQSDIDELNSEIEKYL